ncbi:DsbE family thiol:disulfide interchange protein [Enterovirga aerilata]|uniref:DsbE family thiol:disulfide interchange protein n=1 Tax=Enterovirga aerilata TaxID=2730920 RepID=UPI003D2C7AF1
MSRILYLVPVLIFAGLAALFMARLHSGDPSRLPSALIGRPVPAFELPPVEGLRTEAGEPVPGLSAASLKGGKVTILNVWASWCAPCRIEHPVLMELAKDASIRLVGFNYKDKPENARRFLGNFGNPFAAVGADETGRTAIDFGVYGVPETFVIGRDGTIRHKHVGPLTPDALPGFMAEVRKAGGR